MKCLGDSSFDEVGHNITSEGGIHFGAVAGLHVGQRPTFRPELSFLRDSSTPTVAPRARRPTAVPKWIPLTSEMLRSDRDLCSKTATVR